MFLPLGDEPNPRGIPWVTYGLIVVNVVVYLFISLPLSLDHPDANDPLLLEYVQVLFETLPQGRFVPSEVMQQLSAYDLYVFDHGFRPAAPVAIALLTSMFLHAGFAHLAGNMLFLWIYGDNVEHRLGPVLYLAAYLATGVAATLFHTVFDLESVLPLVGASGAISGVLGFYFVWFPHNRVRVWVLLFPFFMNVITLPARIVLGFYLVFSNLLPFLISQGMPGGGVAYGAHIGGFLGGLGWAWWAGQREMSARPAEYRQGWTASTPSAGELVAEMVEESQFFDAAQAYFQLASERSRRVLTPAHSISLGAWLAQHRHSEAALVIYQRHLRDYPLGPLAAEAHLGAGLVQLGALGQPAAAYQHLVEVFDHDPDLEVRRQARHALNEIAERQKYRVH
jgi:membrane associated rhomboid family serine protease